MATLWGTHDLKTDDSELFAFEWNHEVRASCTQTQGALRAHGQGVVSGLKVTKTSTASVAIEAGQALLASTVHGFVSVVSPGASLNLADTNKFGTIAPDGDVYLLAAITAATVPDEEDSRESGVVEWRVQTDDLLDGGLVLAKITFASGAITVVDDQRTFSSLEGLRLQILALENEVQLLTDRVELLENGDGTTPGPSGPVYLSQIKWSSEDPRSSDIVLQAKMDALEARLTALIESGGRLPAESRLDLYAHRQAVLIHKVGEENPLHTLDFEGAYVQRGLFGDGNGHTENFIVATTMTETDRGWVP